MLSTEEINKLLPGGHTVIKDGYFYIYYTLETPMTKANGTIDRYTYKEIMRHINILKYKEEMNNNRVQYYGQEPVEVPKKISRHERSYKYNPMKKMVCIDCKKECIRRGGSQKRCVICQNRVDRERTKYNNNLKTKTKGLH